MDIDEKVNILVDVGCGYGIFLLPIADIVRSKVIGLDIDEGMIEVCRNKVAYNGIQKAELIKGDMSNKETIKLLEEYTGQIDYITLFNILHCEEPNSLLKSAYNILADSGKIGIIHWKYEDTPRGPSIEIRPKPEMVIKWALEAGFDLDKKVELPPYHYGLVFTKNRKGESLQ